MNGWSYQRPQVIIIKRKPKRRKARYPRARYHVPQRVTYRDVERTARIAGKSAKTAYVVSKRAYATTRPIAASAGKKAFGFAKWGAGKVKERYRPSYEPGPRPKNLYRKTEKQNGYIDLETKERKGFFSKLLRR